MRKDTLKQFHLKHLKAFEEEEKKKFINYTQAIHPRNLQVNESVPLSTNNNNNNNTSIKQAEDMTYLHQTTCNT